MNDTDIMTQAATRDALRKMQQNLDGMWRDYLYTKGDLERKKKIAKYYAYRNIHEAARKALEE